MEVKDGDLEVVKVRGKKLDLMLAKLLEEQLVKD